MTSRCWYGPTGASGNTCGLTSSFSSTTSRTTIGLYWPTRICPMYGSLAVTCATPSRNAAVSSMPSMSTTMRSGGVSRIMKCLKSSGVSCSSATRV